MTADGRPLRDSLEDYLALRRALGFRLKTAGRLLDQFVSWLDDRGSDTITTEEHWHGRCSRQGPRRLGSRSDSA